MDELIQTLNEYTSKLNDVDAETSDEILFTIYDHIVEYIVKQHTPDYYITNNDELIKYVTKIIPRELFDKIELHPTRWRQKLNNEFKRRNTYPFKAYYKTKVTICNFTDGLKRMNKFKT